ncbi:LPXTG cell wall anchor domain-containing protein [Clostridium baratii]|uniref:LPXTG cell wall anchor domain-containing protein n=1 Tax=Clostridium baratii TaxID=1561 RepID=UPI002A75B611|nr:LPXTG cell wall anchor domain-containing protein [Clostridium baratii]MDY3208681.1 LPXTG cell wall anchor domain-containing protein [Clostridium baratii]
MKNIFKILVISLSLLLITGTIGDAAEIAPPNVELEGNAEGIVYIPGDEPFLEFKGMVPGDRIKRRLVLSNKFTDSYEVFIRAERISGKEENDLLEKLKLKIEYNNSTLHEGDATGEASIKENVSLGKINPGESKELVAEVELDGQSTGNEYKNKSGEVKWIFTAVRTPDEDENTGENTSNNNQSNNNSSNIDSSSKPPKTGDNGILGYLIVIISCFIVFKVVNRKGRKA